MRFVPITSEPDQAMAAAHRVRERLIAQPDIRDEIPYEPSLMHETRRRPIRRNPHYLHTVRRSCPSSGRTCGLALKRVIAPGWEYSSLRMTSIPQI
jgi:hypothetical protein